MRVKASYQLFEFSYFPLFKKNLGNCWPMGGSRLESPLSSTIKKQSIHSRQRISRTPSFGYYTPSGARGCYLVHLLQFSFLVRIIASRFALLGIRFFASFPIVRNQTMNYLCANENYSPPESSGSMRNYFPKVLFKIAAILRESFLFFSAPYFQLDRQVKLNSLSE